MKIISQSWKFQHPISSTILQSIEEAGRICYKSEDKITKDSAEDFVRGIMKRGHLSVIEHCYASVRIVTDRGVTHELVRHRLASYSQESTRYCNFSKNKFGNEITVIEPVFWQQPQGKLWVIWRNQMLAAEKAYMRLLEVGAKPEEARSVLPNSLKTEIVMTCNLREWRHCFNQRCSPAAHPQMRALMLDMLEIFNDKIPVIFEGLAEKYLS